MTLKTPSFWYPENPGRVHWAGYVLRPLSCLYDIGGRMKARGSDPAKMSCPVICVGNLNAGGSGKTPVAIAVMNLVRAQHIAVRPFFLTRGYGGSVTGPVWVDADVHRYEEVGDEALLLARHAPTIVSVDRHAGAQAAVEAGADLIIMDDGLQNYDIKQDLKIAVVDGMMGFGNGLVIPAGPLRENLKDGLEKPDIFIVIGDDRAGVQQRIPGDKICLHAQLQSDESSLQKAGRYIAFCGLGYPQKFFSGLEKLGVQVLDTQAFPDHYPYTNRDMALLIEKAERHDARLVTTEKDLLRISSEYHPYIDIVPVAIHIEDMDLLIASLKGLNL